MMLSAETAAGESIRWYPQVRIEKYSPDQASWAMKHLETAWLHGDHLRMLYPLGPEDGYACDEGNSMVRDGLANLITVLTGQAGRPMAPGTVCVGVGSDGTTGFDAGQTHLANLPGEGDGSSWYQPMDAGYPACILPDTILGQASFQAPRANWPWLEWCWVAGSGAPAPGPRLGSVYPSPGSAVMMNRKIPPAGLGRKDTGACWVFVTTVSFS